MNSDTDRQTRNIAAAKAANAAHRARLKTHPHEFNCACSRQAYRAKWGEPVCERCDKIENELKTDNRSFAMSNIL